MLVAQEKGDSSRVVFLLECATGRHFEVIGLRLCRLMCGRSLTFGNALSLHGATPQISGGAAPFSKSAGCRWGIAATAHQTAEPWSSHFHFADLLHCVADDFQR
jgi:hypothetical protein